MSDLFVTPQTKKEEPNKPQEIEFVSAKKSKIKIIYKPMIVGGIAKSPVLIENLKKIIDAFEKEIVKEVKKDETKTS